MKTFGSSSRGHCLLVVGLIFLILSMEESLAQQSNSPFTQDEVKAGHVGYHGNCAGCHGDNLQGGGLGGGGDAPPLTGALFNQDWSKYTIKTLYQYVSKTMPDGLAGDLSANTYSQIVSFLLAANGAKAGPTAFDPNSNITIGDIANGVTVYAVTNAPLDEQAEPQHQSTGPQIRP
jgi:mono/diheme cytochrome c family protein